MKLINIVYTIKGFVKPIKIKINEKIAELRYESAHRDVIIEKEDNACFRINIILPSINEQDLYGGISTALNFFVNFYEKANCEARIIVMDKIIKPSKKVPSKFFDKNNSKYCISVVGIDGESINIREKDFFIATYWTTALLAEKIIMNKRIFFGEKYEVLVYIIQDFEPGFYPWSSEYVESERTYQFSIRTIAIFNSKYLAKYFDDRGYFFYNTYSFEPVLNNELKQYLNVSENDKKRKKQILIYGRPNEYRNAFMIVIDSLKKLSVILGDEAREWNVISLGTKHKNIILENGMKVISYGKVSLEQYAKIMLESFVGISLMISPHPSYPPLEMSSFGIKTITNCFSNKDLENFNENIISLKKYDADSVANMMYDIIKMYGKIKNNLICDNEYLVNEESFDEIIESLLLEIFN